MSLEFILLFPQCISIELLVYLFKFCWRFFPCGCVFISEFCYGAFVHRLNRCFYCASFLKFVLVFEYLILNFVFAICWSALRQLKVLFLSLLPILSFRSVLALLVARFARTFFRSVAFCRSCRRLVSLVTPIRAAFAGLFRCPVFCLYSV